MSEQVSDKDTSYPLQIPITFEGEKIEKLNLDFERLTGKDLLVCAKIARQLDPEESVIAAIRAFSATYQVAVAASAANVTPDHIQALKGPDYIQVTQQAANFLMGQG
jgi:hypothetical protein